MGTLPGLNVFHVSANDFYRATDMILDLKASNDSTTAVVINVLYDDDYTGPFTDPNGVLDADRTKAVDINMVAFGLSGMFLNTSIVSKIIWNFPYATAINMSYVGFRGTILAPDAGETSFLSNVRD